MPVVMTACSEADVWVSALNRRQLLAQEHESLTAWQNAAELYHLHASCLDFEQTIVLNDLFNLKFGIGHLSSWPYSGHARENGEPQAEGS